MVFPKHHELSTRFSVTECSKAHLYSSLGFQNFSGGNTPGAPAYKGRVGEGRERGEEGGKGPHNNVCLRAPTNLNPALGLLSTYKSKMSLEPCSQMHPSAAG